MSRLLNSFAEVVDTPQEQLPKRRHIVLRLLGLVLYCYRQLQRHRAEGMAAELTYRTIFSLIPVVVLGLVMFRIVGGLEEVSGNVENELYRFFGVPEIPEGYQSSPVSANSARTFDAQSLLSPVNMQAAIEASEMEEAASKEARASIRRTLREATRKVASVDFKSIGVFGLLLFLYAAVALADSVEQIFNRIYNAPRSRPVHIRLAIHWSIITLGSGLLALSLYMSGQVVEWFVELGVGSNIRLLLSHLLSIVASWVLLFLLYALMPNTHVSVRAALVGSLVGSLLWELAKYGFQIYVTTAVPYSAIYGSIGLVPLFLFWIYVTWLIILSGMILTYTLQSVRGNSALGFVRNEVALIHGDPDWMLPIMSEIARSFAAGQTFDNQSLGDRLGMPSRVVQEMTSKLIEAGLLRRVSAGAGGSESLTLARPADKIEIREILNVAHLVRPNSDHPAWTTLVNLKQAEREAAARKTLADV